MQEEPQPAEAPDAIITLQLSIVSKLIKKHIPDKAVTTEFKREFTKGISLFLLYLQKTIDKKKYTREDVIAALEREGLGKVAESVRNTKPAQMTSSAKKAVEIDERGEHVVAE
jgi:hypothetical protein